MSEPGSKKRIVLSSLEKLGWILFGALVTVFLTDPIRNAIHAYKEKQRAPELLLEQAGKDRGRLREADLISAAAKYQSLLDEATNLRVQSYSGLSRTYAELALLKSWRGLSRSDYPERAISFARQAVRIAPETSESGIALAYAYESDEAQQSMKSATNKKVGELLAKGIDNLDTQYLNWSSGASEAKSFPDRLRAEDTSDLRILVDVALHFAKLADGADLTGEQKQLYISRSEEFLESAVHIGPDNGLVLFTKGYLSVVRGNLPQARDYYLRALEKEPEFPRARNNLGYVYAAQRDFPKAIEQFQSAILATSAPARSQLRWLSNIGFAYVEVGDSAKACGAWKQAFELPGANEDPMTFYGLAACDYVNGQNEPATEHFRSAVRLGSKQGIDLKNSSTFEKSKAGPKELEIVKALIQMAK